MATHRAVNQCFHNGHLFQVGEGATFREGEAVPRHFEPIEASTEDADGGDQTNEATTKKGRKKAAS